MQIVDGGISVVLQTDSDSGSAGMTAGRFNMPAQKTVKATPPLPPFPPAPAIPPPTSVIPAFTGMTFIRMLQKESEQTSQTGTAFANPVRGDRKPSGCLASIQVEHGSGNFYIMRNSSGQPPNKSRFEKHPNTKQASGDSFNRLCFSLHGNGRQP